MTSQKIGSRKAIKSPALVAKYLYEHQDEGRFGYQPRLLVVYLDDDVAPGRIKEIIDRTNLEVPIDINFEFNHQTGGRRSYRTKCFVILLYGGQPK